MAPKNFSLEEPVDNAVLEFEGEEFAVAAPVEVEDYIEFADIELDEYAF